jgi:hypothetical protein
MTIGAPSNVDSATEIESQECEQNLSSLAGFLARRQKCQMAARIMGQPAQENTTVFTVQARLITENVRGHAPPKIVCSSEKRAVYLSNSERREKRSYRERTT